MTATAARPDTEEQAEHADESLGLAEAKALIANLQAALVRSRRIGLAMGILMASLHATEDEAFALLRDASQRSRTKLHEIADTVALTGALPPP